MNRRLAIAVLLLWTSSVSAQDPPIAKVSALANGALLLNSRPTNLAALEKELDRLKATNGVVWYYRENAQAEPRPEAMAFVEQVIKRRLPVSMSSKPDFSDYIDASGRSQPRKP